MPVAAVPVALEIAAVATSTVAGVAGAAISAHGEQQEMQARQAMTNLQAQNERLNQVRQARIRMAQIQQAGVKQGVGESSSVTTGASGVQGQAESNIQQIGAQQGLIDNIFSAQQKVISGQGISEIGQAVGKGLSEGANIFGQVNANKPTSS